MRIFSFWSFAVRISGDCFSESKRQAGGDNRVGGFIERPLEAPENVLDEYSSTFQVQYRASDSGWVTKKWLM